MSARPAFGLHGRFPGAICRDTKSKTGPGTPMLATPITLCKPFSPCKGGERWSQGSPARDPCGLASSTILRSQSARTERAKKNETHRAADR